MKAADSKFPDFYPEGLEVPHPEATQQEFEKLYRFSSNDPALQEDFLAKTQESCAPSYRRKHKNNPRFYGTSFFTEKSKLISLQDTFPDTFGRKVITNGSVQPELGYSLKEKQHVCIWFFKGCYPQGFTS